MDYVIGVDLGTSAVKTILINRAGTVLGSASRAYPISRPESGFSEQNPEDWYAMTLASLKELVSQTDVPAAQIAGLSFSGQMHGLVLLDAAGQVLRPAILWNDTRTASQRDEIEHRMGASLLKITKNEPLEGFTLPKLLWVKENEPAVFAKIANFLLPKDYLRYRLTGHLAQEISDASGTVMLNTISGQWSEKIFKQFDVPLKIAPTIVQATDYVGSITEDVAGRTGLSPQTKVFGGGADNACGALGAGIVSADKVLCSIGTSGVVAAFEPNRTVDYQGRLHFFNHAITDNFYSMGVTLAAGDSLTFIKNLFRPTEDFATFASHAAQSLPGADGLIFTPYISGERTPYADAELRGAFVGIDARQTLASFVRAVLEGITFSLNDVLNIYKDYGRRFSEIIAIGGGAKSDTWLQIQADVFNQTVSVLENEEGPAMGAAMIAAVGLGWFPDFQSCARDYVQVARVVTPNAAHAARYPAIYQAYRRTAADTATVSHELARIRE